MMRGACGVLYGSLRISRRRLLLQQQQLTDHGRQQEEYASKRKPLDPMRPSHGLLLWTRRSRLRQIPSAAALARSCLSMRFDGVGEGSFCSAPRGGIPLFLRPWIWILALPLQYCFVVHRMASLRRTPRIHPTSFSSPFCTVAAAVRSMPSRRQ